MQQPILHASVLRPHAPHLPQLPFPRDSYGPSCHTFLHARVPGAGRGAALQGPGDKHVLPQPLVQLWGDGPHQSPTCT